MSMKFKVVSPIKAYLENPTEGEIDYLRNTLTYTNTSVQHLLKRHYDNRWFRSSNPDGWDARLDQLKSELKRTMLFEEDGKYFVRPGSIPFIDNATAENTLKYPLPKKIAWAKPLPFELKDYQQKSVDGLIEAKHGHVEICTGAGKSAILLKLCRETGFRAAIIAPSKSIFNELREAFEFHLGRANVGAFGDGKKKIGKRITICIGDSICNVVPGSEEWNFFSGLDMLCVDESHTWGADTLEEICNGVLANIPYRFFLSGTQTRGDGGEKLLQSIIGKRVVTLSTKDAIAGGHICPHTFTIVRLESSNPNYSARDALAMKRVHFLGNKNIAVFVTKLANAAASQGQQTLVLVEELSQIAMLLPNIGVPTAIAHSETKPDRLAELGLHKVDPAESVEKFNKGEVMVLIGTSCIATGTNIFPVHNCVNWVGGASEIKTKQGAVGRSVRFLDRNPFKNNCAPKPKATIWDFDVYDIDLMTRHLDTRLEYYADSGTEIKHLNIARRK